MYLDWGIHSLALSSWASQPLQISVYLCSDEPVGGNYRFLSLLKMSTNQQHFLPTCRGGRFQERPSVPRAWEGLPTEAAYLSGFMSKLPSILNFCDWKTLVINSKQNDSLQISWPTKTLQTITLKTLTRSLKLLCLNIRLPVGNLPDIEIYVYFCT